MKKRNVKTNGVIHKFRQKMRSPINKTRENRLINICRCVEKILARSNSKSHSFPYSFESITNDNIKNLYWANFQILEKHDEGYLIVKFSWILTDFSNTSRNFHSQLLSFRKKPQKEFLKMFRPFSYFLPKP